VLSAVGSLPHKALRRAHNRHSQNSASHHSHIPAQCLVESPEISRYACLGTRIGVVPVLQAVQRLGVLRWKPRCGDKNSATPTIFLVNDCLHGRREPLRGPRTDGIKRGLSELNATLSSAAKKNLALDVSFSHTGCVCGPYGSGDNHHLIYQLIFSKFVSSSILQRLQPWLMP
jgi:hypothetical protein